MTKLEQSRALWNRDHLDLRSDEILAQILDRGDIDDWRALYALATRDKPLRERIHRIVRRVPMAYGHFWLAALRSLGVAVDFDVALPREDATLAPRSTNE